MLNYLITIGDVNNFTLVYIMFGLHQKIYKSSDCNHAIGIKYHLFIYYSNVNIVFSIPNK